MQFLCFGYYNSEKMDALPQAEIEAIMRQCEPHIRALHETGKVIVDAGLALETKTLRRVNGEIETIACRVSEAKLMIGGVFILEAEDMDEAIRLAMLHPTTQVNGVEAFGWTLEVRPIHSFKAGAG